jgi:hypothetical protein
MQIKLLDHGYLANNKIMKKYNSLKAFYDQPKDGKKITKGQQQGKKGFTKNRETGKVKATSMGKLNY